MNLHTLITTGILSLCVGSIASGEILLDVSVKFVVDAQGNRTSGNMSTDQDVISEISACNEVLTETGRGYVLNLVEIIDLPPSLGGFFNSCDQDLIDTQAKASPSLWSYRTDAINFYVTNGDCAGICAFPAQGQDIILIGRGHSLYVFLHEIGHYMSLCHTQGCLCGICQDEGLGLCDTIPGDDLIPDTLPDLPCWSQDDIAQWSFGQDYGTLTLDLQSQVDDVFFNIMSYHGFLGLDQRLTQLQLDVWADVASGMRANVASGVSVFVDGSYLGLSTGASGLPWITVNDGYAASLPGDILMIRSTVYDEPGLVLTEPRLLLTPEGSAVIR